MGTSRRKGTGTTRPHAGRQRAWRAAAGSPTRGDGIPVVLTIAGSDSGGGAGIQADLKVFARLGVFGTTAITAITAQNTMGVQRIESVDPGMVRAQIDAVVSDLAPSAVKSGMLANAGIVHAVAAGLRAYRLAKAASAPGRAHRVSSRRPTCLYVLDPVMVASSGTALLDSEGVAVLARELLPLADLVTPNLDEARLLVGEAVSDIRGMARAARLLVDRWGARAALVTGGHLTGPQVVDVLYDGTVVQFAHRRIDTRHTHGTGCTLSAAIAARLALGDELPIAVGTAIRYVGRMLRGALSIGSGVGPVG